jgi:DNA-binding HxlR family transcriptional regulator
MTHEHRFEHDSVERTLAIVGDRWAFLIIREAFFGVRRFGQLARNLGLSRNILSARLRTLVEYGILERRPYQADPERHEYLLTDAGRDLYPAIVGLMQWGDRHLAGADGPPLVLRHRTCGHVADPRLVCGHCGEELRARDVEPEAGPGAERASVTGLTANL